MPAERHADAGAVAGVLVEPLLDVVDAQPGERDVEAFVGLGLGRRDGCEQPLAQHPELQVVEELVHLLAVPLLPRQIVRRDVELDVADEFGEPPVQQRRRRGSRAARRRPCP